jgi:hypothetical protein
VRDYAKYFSKCVKGKPLLFRSARPSNTDISKFKPKSKGTYQRNACYLKTSLNRRRNREVGIIAPQHLGNVGKLAWRDS